MINQIPGKLQTSYNMGAQAVIDKWQDYNITLDEFKEAIIDKALTYGKTHGAKAFIVDSTEAKGVFSSEIQHYIEQNVFKAFADSGIKYFITTSSEVSAITNLNINSFSSKAGPHGIELVKVNNKEEAINWLKMQ